jgi:hypothetical protein
MSAVIHDHGHDHNDDHGDHAHHPGGIMRWISTNIAYEILSNQPRPPLWS